MNQPAMMERRQYVDTVENARYNKGCLFQYVIKNDWFDKNKIIPFFNISFIVHKTTSHAYLSVYVSHMTNRIVL